ncbi:RHS repeat-associated core domain-containing protein, partial [Flavobacterium psychrophilum]
EGFVGNGLPEKDVFYYHPDHLGSSSYISTLNGQISQHVEYIAFGEVLFEEHSSSFKSPYLFNGKELDRETNLSYYGARYLDMKTSLWLSVDPLAEKFPRWSPYSYAFDNPMRYTDPTGMAPVDIIILSYGKNENSGSGTHHPHGHQAILVGDDKKGWKYYSLDGDVTNEPTNNNYTIAEFKTLKEFSSSEYNTFKVDYDDGNGTATSEKSENGEIKQRYAEGFMIQTTEKQDNDMNLAAKEVTKKGHNMVTNNCTTVPTAALDAAGLKNGEVSNDGPFGLSWGNYTPNAKQAEIERANKGKDVDDKLKRE